MKNQRPSDQRMPVVNSNRGIQDMVIEDIESRKQVGIETYGTVLQAHNGRDALVDLYEELLDACVYIRQVIEERDSGEFMDALRERFPLIDVSPPSEGECCGEGCCGD